MYVADFCITGENSHHGYLPETGVIWKITLTFPINYRSMNYSSVWENRISAPDISIADYYKNGNLRHYYLVAEPIKRDILSTIKIEALGYNGTTPGNMALKWDKNLPSIK